MDGVMSSQLRRSWLAMSAMSWTQVSMGSASGLHTEMPSITETIPAEHMVLSPGCGHNQRHDLEDHET